MDFTDPLKLLSEQVVDDFHQHGRHLFAEPVSPTAASDLLADIRATRRFDASLFLSEEAFDANPQHTGVNPRPGRNLLDRFEDRLGFVEEAPAIVHALTTLLGPGYELLNRKIVCGVPARSVPAWLRSRIEGRPVNNLGAYVRPEARDVTYFYGIDFHQDLIDYKDREADFLTLYVYLHPVGVHDAPLHLLDGSHQLGASVFPHHLQRSGPTTWRYRNGAAGEAEVRQRVLTGETGFAALWHACALHGTQPHAADRERISLRYLFAPGRGRAGRIREINAALEGPSSLNATRVDLDGSGAAMIRHNTVNGA
jgi:hypothetical protein